MRVGLCVSSGGYSSPMADSSSANCSSTRTSSRFRLYTRKLELQALALSGVSAHVLHTRQYSALRPPHHQQTTSREHAVEPLRSRRTVVGGVPNRMRTHHYESSALVQASVDRVFAYVDDPARLSSHMSQSSWQMGGGQMVMELDEGRGQRVGSRMRLAGRVLGMTL